MAAWLTDKQPQRMEITSKRLSDIIPYKANAKKHDKRQIKNVAESIKQYGFVQLIVIDRDGVIVIGHCHALAAQQLGMEKFIKHKRRRGGVYGKAKKGNRPEAVRNSLWSAMYAS